MKATLRALLFIGAAPFLFIGCATPPPVVEPPLSLKSPGEKFLFPVIVNHTFYYGCHPAFRSLYPLNKGASKAAKNFQHLDGSPQIPYTEIKCDTCRKLIPEPLLLYLSTAPCPVSKAE